VPIRADPTAGPRLSQDPAAPALNTPAALHPAPPLQEWADGPPAKCAGAAGGLLAALLTILARGRARPPGG
jgi:hypothetical protein